MVEFLANEYKENFLATTNYTNPKQIIQQSAVTTNQSVCNDLNFRVFESMGFGTTVLTNFVEDIDKIEGLKTRLHCFHNLHELKEQLDMLLNNPDLGLKENAYEAQQWVKEKHTMKNRLSEMLQMIDTCKQKDYK